MSKNYSYDEAPINIEETDGRKWALFDVSPTIECRWIAICNNEVYLLEVIGDTREAREFVAQKQIKGATVKDDGILNEWAQVDGFDRWAEWVADELGEYRHES